MATMTLKGIPREVHRRLKARAQRNHRSLNSEAIFCLAAAVTSVPIDPEAILARARQLRARIGGHLTDGDLARAKAEGRP